MATKVDFKRTVRDHAKLEGEAQISVGTTTFTGDGDRLFLNFKEVGILFSHEDAEDFLKAAMAAYLRLGYGGNSGSSGEA
ncbi:MAG: hypothetical protein AAFY42_10440 [Pseudomonadota bacterium]